MNNKQLKYKEHLRSLYWQKVRQVILVRDNSECTICGRVYELHTHHIRYTKKGKSIIGEELKHLESLILLCRDCHFNLAHGKNKEQVNWLLLKYNLLRTFFASIKKKFKEIPFLICLYAF